MGNIKKVGDSTKVKQLKATIVELKNNAAQLQMQTIAQGQMYRQVVEEQGRARDELSRTRALVVALALQVWKKGRGPVVKQEILEDVLQRHSYTGFMVEESKKPKGLRIVLLEGEEQEEQEEQDEDED